MGNNGKKAWAFSSEQDYKTIETLAARVDENIIAKIFGVSERTFQRAMKRDPKARKAFDSGYAKATVNVAETAYQMAVSGKNPAATFFWMKCRALWRETNRTELVGDNGKPIETKSKISLVIKDYRSDGGK